MEIKLHTLRFFCPECKAECQIFEIEADATGEMNFYGRCKDCSQPNTAYAFKSSMAVIKRFCREADGEKDEEADVQPEQKLLPKPPNGLSDEDLKFLKDFHIDDEPPEERTA
jgi:hypothetical protein